VVFEWFPASPDSNFPQRRCFLKEWRVTSGNSTSAPVKHHGERNRAGSAGSAAVQIGANQYVVAQLSDGTYVLQPARSQVSVPAGQARETVVIYGVGFGSVVPNIPAARS